jgi:hypothetical protein
VKKMRCYVFIGRCKTRVIHRLLIECFLKRELGKMCVCERERERERERE